MMVRKNNAKGGRNPSTKTKPKRTIVATPTAAAANPYLRAGVHNQFDVVPMGPVRSAKLIANLSLHGSSGISTV
jgi:hypothetical protein